MCGARRTHNLVDHNQHTCLCVLHGLEVAVDGAAQAGVHARVDVAVEARRLHVGLLGHEQEDVGLGGLGDEVELVEHGASDVLRGGVNDELRVNIDKGRSLCQDVSMCSSGVVRSISSSSLPERWASN